MGATYRTYFSDGFIRDTIGIITGSALVSRFPSVPGYLFRLKTASTNIGAFKVGTLSGTAQQYFELSAGDDTGWFKVAGDNLSNLFYTNVSGASEVVSYWSQI